MVLGAILGAGIGMLTGVTASLVQLNVFAERAACMECRSVPWSSARQIPNALPIWTKPLIPAALRGPCRRTVKCVKFWSFLPIGQNGQTMKECDLGCYCCFGEAPAQQVAWMNRMIDTLWPHYNHAVANIVHETVTPILEETCRKVKILSSISIEKMDLGTKPMKLGGIKTYETREDEVIIEAPVLWGSNADIRVHVSIQLGPLRIFIPVSVKNLQLHAVARITIRPLVETLPCLGALHISLLNPPHIDMTLNLINGMDFMALPGIREISSSIVQGVLGSMMLYPNQFSVDLMEGGGQPPAPMGMLRVKLIRVENLRKSDVISKSDAYCLLEVREGRALRSETVKNSQNPVFDEEFHLIVDDPEEQSLKITVKDDDFGWSDHVFGTYKVRLSELECFSRPRQPFPVSGDLTREESSGLLASGSKSVRRLTSIISPSRKSIESTKSLGAVFLEVTMIPFFRPGVDDANDSSDDEAARADAGGVPVTQPFGGSPYASAHTASNIRDDMKGLLTITLARCMNLAGKDTYVSFSLHDNVTKKTAVQKSSYVVNDDSPRWGDKFDFVMINANSDLTVRVMEKPGFMESMMSMKFTKRGEDKPIGVIRIAVADLVRNGRLKDTWALQEVQQGEIELTLTWTTCEFA